MFVVPIPHRLPGQSIRSRVQHPRLGSPHSSTLWAFLISHYSGDNWQHRQECRHRTRCSPLFYVGGAINRMHRLSSDVHGCLHWSNPWHRKSRMPESRLWRQLGRLSQQLHYLHSSWVVCNTRSFKSPLYHCVQSRVVILPDSRAACFSCKLLGRAPYSYVTWSIGLALLKRTDELCTYNGYYHMLVLMEKM